MTSINEVIALVKAHYAGEDDAFDTEVYRIIESAEKAGKGGVASALRTAHRHERSKRPMQPKMSMLPLADQSSSNKLVRVFAPTRSFDDLMLSAHVQTQLDRVVSEHRAADRLRSYGFEPARKLLLCGPPGTGKTVTADALANALGLPLCVVQTHEVVAALLGDTGKNLHSVFDMIAQRRGVYFFDEFDSLAHSRNSGEREVGEMRRVVNTLLVAIEGDASASLILAATNMRGRIDEAFTRRFDMILNYDNASEAMAEAILRAQFARFDTSELTFDMLRVLAADMSHADVEAACIAVAKDAVLSGGMKITDRAVRRAILSRRRHAGVAEPMWRREHDRFNARLREFAEEDRAEGLRSEASLNLSRALAKHRQDR